MQAFYFMNNKLLIDEGHNNILLVDEDHLFEGIKKLSNQSNTEINYIVMIFLGFKFLFPKSNFYRFIEDNKVDYMDREYLLELDEAGGSITISVRKIKTL